MMYCLTIKRRKTKHLAITAKYPQVGFRRFVDRKLVFEM
jgi:hypothetical protein